MGAPKQKWTAEEEAALKAGVHKHGPGKWRTILSDPEFNAVLKIRSNVDLKDKWRNINVTTVWGSRQKAKLAVKKILQAPEHDENSKALSTVVQGGEEIVGAKPLAICSGTQKNTSSKPPKRLEKLIFEAITALKEPCGSDGASIALYIKEKHWAPPNLKTLLSRKLNLLVAYHKLIMVNYKYQIPPKSTVSEEKRSVPLSIVEGNKKDLPKSEKCNSKVLAKSQVSALEAAAAAAAKAVAAAEAAIAEAEAAAREAEAAEAEAEAAQVFAKAAMKAFECLIA